MATFGAPLPRVKPLQEFNHDHANRFIRELNAVLAQLGERINKLPFNAKGQLKDHIDANGFQVRNLGIPKGDTEAVTLDTFRSKLEDVSTDVAEQSTTEVTDSSTGGFTFFDPTSEQGGGASDGGGADAAVAELDSRFKEVEIDFGAQPTRYKTFAIDDKDATTNSRIIVTQNAEAATGRSADENEMDRLAFATRPVTATPRFELLVTGLEGPLVGKYKISYVIGGT